MTQHLCLTCKLAEWKKTPSGRLNPSGEGRCTWRPAYIPTATAWHWAFDRAQPVPVGGWITRRPAKPIVQCETYQGNSR